MSLLHMMNLPKSQKVGKKHMIGIYNYRRLDKHLHCNSTQAHQYNQLQSSIS